MEALVNVSTQGHLGLLHVLTSQKPFDLLLWMHNGQVPYSTVN